MTRKPLVSCTFFIFFFLLLSLKPVAATQVNTYGLLQPSDKEIIEKRTQRSLDSLYNNSVFFRVKDNIYSEVQKRPWVNKTADFYILLGLVLFLGMIRFMNPKYLGELWTAYFNTGFSGRALRDKIEQSTLPNMLMNIFFVWALGCYMFYVFKSVVPARQHLSIHLYRMAAMISGVAMIYLVKYLVIRFTGWAFDMKGVTDTYLFNVFLVNKILAVALLPFTVVMAFQDLSWAPAAVVLSFILALALFISRYVKSWQVLGSFFHYSKFHFFTYLCASEIMPLAVLTKFLLAHPL